MRCGLSVFQPPKSATIKLTHYRVLAIALNCSWLMDRSECPRAKDDGLTVENGRGRRSLATRRPLIARYAARRGNVSVRPNRTTTNNVYEFQRTPQRNPPVKRHAGTTG